MPLGTEDFSKPISANIWLDAMTRSESPTPFYPKIFQLWADTVLRVDFDMDQQDISQSFCLSLYRHLVTHPTKDLS